VGAGQNDISKATDAGTFSISKSGGVITVSYDLLDGFDLGSVHVSVSCSAPKKCSPGDYTVKIDPLPGTADQSLSVQFDSDTPGLSSCWNSGKIYFIVHADVNQQFPADATCPEVSI